MRFLSYSVRHTFVHGRTSKRISVSKSFGKTRSGQVRNCSRVPLDDPNPVRVILVVVRSPHVHRRPTDRFCDSGVRLKNMFGSRIEQCL